ncbi:MAG: hypothetical protein E6J90_39600 [Deltaproteobacteria bacterium]|nr:MAG: hypothetical protein E6J90_39600 [Deltaproteobacteria bacterium]TMQ21972.1 MAG: hypothetical protein E6J91_01885 [Deltaproteobacteria bacterium]
MSSIGGPGGAGPGGSGESGGPDGVEPAARTAQGDPAAAPAPVAARTLEALAAELAAGRLAPHDAARALVERIAATGALDAAQRTELRQLLTDLVTNDPYLRDLVGR